MDFPSLSFMFNRAFALTFSKKKLFMVFCVLALSGLVIVFFRGLGLHAGRWVQLSLTFLPIFICTGILLSLGIFLIRIYRNEIKKAEENYWEVLIKSWDVMMGASYFAIPIIVCYLLLWLLLGIFVLLSEIPNVGDFFSSILAFAPFLINLGTLVLCVIGLIILFYVAPVIALKGLEKRTVLDMTMQRLEKDPFTNIVLLLTALIPFIVVFALLLLAAFLTGSLCIDCHDGLQTILKWFFIMLPFSAFLTPTVVFFFNFAAESHVLMQKQPKV